MTLLCLCNIYSNGLSGQIRTKKRPALSDIMMRRNITGRILRCVLCNITIKFMVHSSNTSRIQDASASKRRCLDPRGSSPAKLCDGALAGTGGMSISRGFDRGAALSSCASPAHEIFWRTRERSARAAGPERNGRCGKISVALHGVLIDHKSRRAT